LEVTRQSIFDPKVKSFYRIEEVCQDCPAGKTADGIFFEKLTERVVLEEGVIRRTGLLRFQPER
jgi:hypothetical protein